KIVRELQDLSMSMRMIELRPTFQKLARVVRDTAVKAGKEVTFSVAGEDVEIDRQLADLLGDPLVHMVRNAVDHGVERPDERVAAGKARTGSVRLHAYHASGNVVVELIDDGRGLHREKIVAKAIEKGLIESDKGMSDSDVFNLIFAPGFSTAEKVTDISGRGVGMDVVRRNLEAIRGRIDITSAPGQGTTFAIRLPLTLAVTDGMLVRVGQERYVVPTTNIHMSFRPEPSMLSSVVGKGEVVLLRGELMPIVRLHRLFDVPSANEDPMNGLLMIVGDAERRTALLVDELLGQQQVVAKSLGGALGKVAGVSGGAILGDGRVGLILDVAETLALANGYAAGAGRAALAA
nr:chemotaxis protein CheA [Gemmatimonadaceae bacterium]